MSLFSLRHANKKLRVVRRHLFDNDNYHYCGQYFTIICCGRFTVQSYFDFMCICVEYLHVTGNSLFPPCGTLYMFWCAYQISSLFCVLFSKVIEVKLAKENYTLGLQLKLLVFNALRKGETAILRGYLSVRDWLRVIFEVHWQRKVF